VGTEQPEMLAVFSGPNAEQESRTFIVDTWTWIAMDEVHPQVADLYWEAADWLMTDGEGAVFSQILKGVTYWRRVLN